MYNNTNTIIEKPNLDDLNIIYEQTIETPSKVILCGEHAVVDGYGALSMAINLTINGFLVYYHNKNNKNNKNNNIITINLKDLDIILNIKIDELNNISLKNTGNNLKYVVCSLRNTINYLIEKNKLDKNNINNFNLKISSNIPISCGLGSSASVIITIIKSVLIANKIKLSKEEIANIAYNVEKEVQSKASITDTSTIVYNGILKIKNNSIEKINNNKFNKLISSSEFLIVHCEARHKKTAQLVNEVAKNKDKEKIFKEIGNIVNKIENTTTKEELGKLLIENHILLDKLGVSTNKLNKVVEVAKKYSYGGKLSGAGGGGIAIILVKENSKKQLIRELEKLNVIKIYNCKIVY